MTEPPDPPHRPDRTAHPAAGESNPDANGRGDRPAGPICDICGAIMYERHCKIACPSCGYLRDCSDP